METPQDRNKEIVRYVHDQVNKGNLGVFEEVLSGNYSRPCQAMPPGTQEIRGAGVLAAWVKEHIEAFPDWRDDIDFLLAEGDFVSYVTTSTGTQTGAMGPFHATGKQVRLVSIIFQRFENEKIAETWISWDNVWFLTQLGHMPSPPAPAAHAPAR